MPGPQLTEAQRIGVVNRVEGAPTPLQWSNFPHGTGSTSETRLFKIVLATSSTYFPIKGILMKAQVDQLNHMSETLESSGFTPRQSNAVIESVALAMETFAVTPKLLEERLEQHTEQILRVIRAQGESIKVQGEATRDLQRSVSRLEQASIDLQASMLDHQRSMFRIMMVFMVALLTTVLGVFGTIVKPLLFP